MENRNTKIKILSLISFGHFANDTMQSLVIAVYPMLKNDFSLTFTQIGLITFVYQLSDKVNFQDLRAGDDQPVPMTFNYSNKILKVSYDQALVGSTFTISTVEGQTLYSGFPQVSNGSFVIPVTLNSSDMYVLTIENSEGLLYTVFTLADL